MQIRATILEDIPHVVQLINRAYRGEGGWTNESHLFGGPRTKAADMEELLGEPGGVILSGWEEGELAGCVYLKKEAEKLYLGMLSVSPARQGAGIGKHLVAAATKYARQQGCKAIRITVISVRDEVIAWYERQGFRRTGEREPFPSGKSHGATKQPLELAVLEKDV
jgi:ribosomal protein S18 acetylase RimI-like enzyme